MRSRWAAAILAPILGCAVLAVGCRIARAWPKQPLRAGIANSSVVLAANGELLRMTLAADGQYRVWVPLAAMPRRLPAAVILYEDRWFRDHPGVNPVALLRAAVNSSGGVATPGVATPGAATPGAATPGVATPGASTISMQLARRLYGIDSRRPLGKLRQIVAALGLEARYSKDEILEAYLNVAPYGGNIEGAGAASRLLFGRSLADLSVPQLMSLAVIPQNPRRRRLLPARQAQDLPSTALDGARARLWRRWLALHPEDARFSVEVARGAGESPPAALPFRAPHFTDAVLRESGGTVHTTLDPARQRTVEGILHEYVSERSTAGIRNAAALLLEMTPAGTARVRAYVGSADYRDPGIEGQVNAITAKRSPGSTLKPFVYALAIDQGIVHPRSILKDAPSSFGAFSPENFDGRFVGPIAAEDALIRSRNVPAVTLASQLSHPDLYEFMRDAGVGRLPPERHYGLALALGGGEVTMEELGRLYATLANGGRATVLESVAAAPGTAPPLAAQPRLLSEEASFITLDMLAKNPRPDTGQPAMPAVAWKTGTSWGFHDAWSVAVFGRYILVVWIGNFDNAGNPAFVGVQAAAPLLFRIIDALRSRGLDPGGLERTAPRNLARVQVCAASGDLPNAECPQTTPTWYIPGKSPIRVSTLHRRIFIDAAGHRVCGPGPAVHSEVYEIWPADMLRLFREAGMPRRAPPSGAACETGAESPQIVSPLRGVAYTLRTGHGEPLELRATPAAGTQRVYWFADTVYLGCSAQGDGLAWLPRRAGHYTLRAVGESGAAASRELEVDWMP